eukprot:GCRY01001257.1.p1 GENE.GCRY01001257.1~~GCRY01001257.1.p1  ORF type:complete len:1264 (+),score=428.22 GCRY01001257.1:287-4078(+)
MPGTEMQHSLGDKTAVHGDNMNRQFNTNKPEEHHLQLPRCQSAPPTQGDNPHYKTVPIPEKSNLPLHTLPSADRPVPEEPKWHHHPAAAPHPEYGYAAPMNPFGYAIAPQYKPAYNIPMYPPPQPQPQPQQQAQQPRKQFSIINPNGQEILFSSSNEPKAPHSTGAAISSVPASEPVNAGKPEKEPVDEFKKKMEELLQKPSDKEVSKAEEPTKVVSEEQVVEAVEEVKPAVKEQEQKEEAVRTETEQSAPQKDEVVKSNVEETSTPTKDEVEETKVEETASSVEEKKTEVVSETTKPEKEEVSTESAAKQNVVSEQTALPATNAQPEPSSKTEEAAPRGTTASPIPTPSGPLMKSHLSAVVAASAPVLGNAPPQAQKRKYDRRFLLDVQNKNTTCPKELEDLLKSNKIYSRPDGGSTPAIPHNMAGPRMGGRRRGGGGGPNFGGPKMNIPHSHSKENLMHQGMRGGRGKFRQRGGRGGGGFQPAAQLHNLPPVPALKTSENAFRAAGKNKEVIASRENLNEEERVVQDLIRDMKGILNKITPESFNKLSKSILDSGIFSDEVLRNVIFLVFDKAISEPNFSSMYAKLCLNISTQARSAAKDHQGNTVLGAGKKFKRYLLNKCQEEFENQPPPKDDEQFEANMKVYKRRMLGNIKFIGELFKNGMLTTSIMFECTTRLLGDDFLTSIDEDFTEGLCKLLTTIGEKLEKECSAAKRKSDLDHVFNQLTQAKDLKDQLSSRLRFMIEDLLQLRQDQWVSRRIMGQDNAPKTLKQIHQEIIQEERAQQHQQHQRRQFPQNNSRQGGRGRERQVLMNPVQTEEAFNLPGPMKKKAPSTGRNVPLGKHSLSLGPQNSQSWTMGSGSRTTSPLGAAKKQGSNPPSRSGSPVAREDKFAEQVDEESIKRKMINCVEEYSNLKDKKECSTTLKEIGGPKAQAVAVAEICKWFLENKVTMFNAAMEVLILACEDGRGIFSSTVFTEGVAPIFEILDDVATDAPNAIPFFSKAIAQLVNAHALSLSILGEASSKGLSSFNLTKVTLLVLKELASLASKEQCARLLMDSRLNVESLLALKGPKYSDKSFDEVIELEGLSFFFPQLQIEKALLRLLREEADCNELTKTVNSLAPYCIKDDEMLLAHIVFSTFVKHLFSLFQNASTNPEKEMSVYKGTEKNVTFLKRYYEHNASTSKDKERDFISIVESYYSRPTSEVSPFGACVFVAFYNLDLLDDEICLEYKERGEGEMAKKALIFDLKPFFANLEEASDTDED